MGTKINIPVATGFYVNDSLPVSHQECTNFIPIISEGNALSEAHLLGTLGITQVATTGSLSSDASRGARKKGGIPYFVNGNALYSLDRSYVDGEESFTTTSLGTVEGSGRVSLSDNGTQLFILVPGGKGYIYDESNVGSEFQEITDSDFTANGNPQHVLYCDGYFICTTDSKKFIVSSLNDGLTWDALDFGSAESDPDSIVAPVIHSNQVFIAGSQTTEGFQNIGGSGFPFQRNNIVLDKGSYSGFSMINSNKQFFMLGGGENEKPSVWSYSGSAYTRVSTDVIDEIIGNYSDTELSATFALTYGYSSQSLVAFNFYDRTFVYNITTGIWHEQKSTIDDSYGDPEQTRWRVNSLVTAYGHTFVGDSEDGRIGKLTKDCYTEYGEPIIRTFSTIGVSLQGDSYRCPSCELTIESGVANEDCTDPKIAMSISRDAKTFGKDRNREIGAIGQHSHRVFWRKNGRMPRIGVLKFTVSDPVKIVIIKLELIIS